MEDLNNVSLVGRLTKDPEMRYTTTGKAITRFTLANSTRDENVTNFINCKAWGKLGEIVGQYAIKGGLVAISGRIETSSYKKEGKRYYNTDVVADFFKLLDGKKKSVDGSHEQQEPTKSNEEMEQGELPW